MTHRRSRQTGRNLLVAGILLSVLLCPALADDSGRVVNLTPQRMGDLVVCRLVTEGLPGERLLQSMRSGLVSEINLELALLDERDKVLGGNRISLQLAFDLWEEIFSVEAGGRQEQFNELSELVSFLGELEDVPVASVDKLQLNQRYRIQVGMMLHPVAPDQRDEVEAAIAGEQRPQREGQDQQEMSLSMGRLIRFFYTDDTKGEQQLQSAWFTRKELTRAED